MEFLNNLKNIQVNTPALVYTAQHPDVGEVRIVSQYLRKKGRNKFQIADEPYNEMAGCFIIRSPGAFRPKRIITYTPCTATQDVTFLVTKFMDEEYSAFVYNIARRNQIELFNMPKMVDIPDSISEVIGISNFGIISALSPYKYMHLKYWPDDEVGIYDDINTDNEYVLLSENTPHFSGAFIPDTVYGPLFLSEPIIVDSRRCRFFSNFTDVSGVQWL